jgi:hypothetical protein
MIHSPLRESEAGPWFGMFAKTSVVCRRLHMFIIYIQKPFLGT